MTSYIQISWLVFKALQVTPTQTQQEPLPLGTQDMGHQVSLEPSFTSESQPISCASLASFRLLFLASSSIGQAWGKLRDVDFCGFFFFFSELTFEWRRMLKWGRENRILLWDGRSPWTQKSKPCFELFYPIMQFVSFSYIFFSSSWPILLSHSILNIPYFTLSKVSWILSCGPSGKIYHLTSLASPMSHIQGFGAPSLVIPGKHPREQHCVPPHHLCPQ